MNPSPTTAREIIEQSDYAEFPETVLHARLCMAFARMEGRSIPQSLRAFALARIPTTRNQNLRWSLEAMSKSRFPEAELTRIKGCIGKMESALTRELRGLEP